MPIINKVIAYNMKRAYVLRITWNENCKKPPSESAETPYKKKGFVLGRKYRHQSPTRWSWIPRKPLGQQAKRAEGLRYRIYPPAALLNRGKTVLRGNPCKTNEKRASNLGTMCAAMCDMMPRLRKTRWNEQSDKTNEKHGSTRHQCGVREIRLRIRK